MMIIHGEDQVASRNYFLDLKKGKSALELTPDGDLSTLVSAVESTSLFGETTTVVLENVFSARPSNAKKELIAYLLKHTDAPIYIWEGKDVSAQLKEVDPKQVKRFDLPKYIFAFMNTPTVELLHKCVETMPVEQVFASLVTRTYKQHQTDKLLKLLDLDYKNKTSQLPYDLTTGLELFLLKN